jgi:chromosome segregation and condensation protein ScpB
MSKAPKIGAIIMFKDKPVSLAGLADILNLPRDPGDIVKSRSRKKRKPDPHPFDRG